MAISLVFNLLVVLLAYDPRTLHVYPNLVQLESNLVWVYTVRIPGDKGYTFREWVVVVPVLILVCVVVPGAWSIIQIS